VVAASLGQRLLLTEGALAAVAARALLAAAADESWVVGLGGVWNEDVARDLATLIARQNIRVVELANATHHPPGPPCAPPRARISPRWGELLDVAAPEGGWLAELRRVRLAPEDLR
jgi:hypothetical protein